MDTFTHFSPCMVQSQKIYDLLKAYKRLLRKTRAFCVRLDQYTNRVLIISADTLAYSCVSFGTLPLWQSAERHTTATKWKETPLLQSLFNIQKCNWCKLCFTFEKAQFKLRLRPSTFVHKATWRETTIEHDSCIFLQPTKASLANTAKLSPIMLKKFVHHFGAVHLFTSARSKAIFSAEHRAALHSVSVLQLYPTAPSGDDSWCSGDWRRLVYVVGDSWKPFLLMMFRRSWSCSLSLQKHTKACISQTTGNIHRVTWLGDQI